MTYVVVVVALDVVVVEVALLVLLVDFAVLVGLPPDCGTSLVAIWLARDDRILRHRCTR